MCASFMVDRCQPRLLPRHTDIWSPGNAGNHFPDANERKTTITPCPTQKSLSRQSQWLSLADALSPRRGTSVFFFSVVPFPEPNNDATVQANARTLTHWQPAAPRISYAAEFLIGHIPLTSLTQGSRIDIEEAGKAQGLSTTAGMLL